MPVMSHKIQHRQSTSPPPAEHRESSICTRPARRYSALSPVQARTEQASPLTCETLRRQFPPAATSLATTLSRSPPSLQARQQEPEVLRLARLTYPARPAMQAISISSPTIPAEPAESPRAI